MKNLFALALLFALFACAAPPPRNDTPPPSTPAPQVTAKASTPELTPRATPVAPLVLPTPSPITTTFALLLAGNASDERAQALQRGFVNQAQASNAIVVTQFADGDRAKQKNQLTDVLAQRVNVVVVQAVDADAATPFVTNAHKANVQVIALDEPIRNPDVDLVVAMDYTAAGKLQAARAVQVLQAQRQNAPWNFVILEKRAGDLTALPLAQGYYAALAPYIDNQRVRIVTDVAHNNNSTGEAISTTLAALTANPAGVNAILANSPELARGALLALDQAHINTPVYVSSADLDPDALRALCSERLQFAAFPPYPLLGEAAANAALEIVQTGNAHATQTFDISGKAVPARLLAPQAITTDTIHADAVQNGIYSYEETTNCIPPVTKGTLIPQITVSATLQLWTDEAEEDAYPYLANLIAQFHQVNPRVYITLTSHLSDTSPDGDLRLAAGWLRATEGAAPPDFVFASNQIVLTATRDLLQPVDTEIDVSRFVTNAVSAVQVMSETLGVPVTYGGHLMLFYNKALLTDPARSSNDLLRLAATGTSVTQTHPYEFALAFDEQDPRYLTPWFLAFGGEFFAARNVTPTATLTSTGGITATLQPTLNTRAMSNTLVFLSNLRAKQVVPPAGDAAAADALFMNGRAAMVISGEWNIPKYRAALGDQLGIARLPLLSATQKNPTPFTSGKYFFAPTNLSGDKLIAAKAFIEFVTSKAVELEMALRFYRLPALREALIDPTITNDALLRASLDELHFGILEPPNYSPCLEEAIRSQMQAAIKGDVKPADAARAMQASAESCLVR